MTGVLEEFYHKSASSRKYEATPRWRSTSGELHDTARPKAELCDWGEPQDAPQMRASRRVNPHHIATMIQWPTVHKPPCASENVNARAKSSSHLQHPARNSGPWKGVDPLERARGLGETFTASPQGRWEREPERGGQRGIERLSCLSQVFQRGAVFQNWNSGLRHPSRICARGVWAMSTIEGRRHRSGIP